ncbi:magnesium/cobalt transporter CorA [Membranihabitans maritimus]|uniref:magnesium/cobalt transporter CorA n=1 Tax=Membranihabitans maritimus TaxID=2904244 RepID=UPI001F010B93|nr:magnesium/cobalt transporter CorA [Membranihabitans maritimus]
MSLIRSTKRKKSASNKIGLPPGSLVYVGKDSNEPTQIELIQYDENESVKTEIQKVKELKSFITDKKVNWVNIDGIHNIDVVESIGKIFNIHPLVLEDILNTDQRPKFDIYEDYFFVSLKVVTKSDSDANVYNVEQISFILGNQYLLSFQEKSGDIFGPVRERLELPISRIRHSREDYLLYALIDLIVDNYLSVIENVGEKIQFLEARISDNPKEKHLKKIMIHKKNLLDLRRIITPLKESLFKMQGYETSFIDPKNEIFFRDVHDHINTIQELIEIYFEINKSLRELYMSNISMKTNEVMKLLTIISTLFIPLTFIVGVYGMNFTNIPELDNPNGYFYVWGVMIVITLILIYYFKRKKWI